MIRFDRKEAFMAPADEAGRRMMENAMEEKHGSLSSVSIGKSILGREISAYRVGMGKRYVCLFGTHHSLESITANLLFLFIDTALANLNQGSANGFDCKLLLSKYSFIIVPCVNPDGVELRHHGAEASPLKERQNRMSGGDFSTWQANGRGVDLNHNYDYRFAEYKALEVERGISAGPTLFSGEYPESEPESRAVANLIRTLAPSAIVSLHSQGEEIFAYPKNAAVGRIANRLSGLTGYTVGIASDTAAYGGLCDYTGSLGIPSFTFEVGRGKNPLPEACVFGIFERIADSLFLLPTLI